MPVAPVTLGVTRDPGTGLWLLPTGDRPWSRSLPSWPPYTPAVRRLILPLLTILPRAGSRLGSEARSLPETVLVPCVLGLVPCPDNDYNSHAVAVVDPGVGGRLDLTAQVGWIRDEHAWSLQSSIVALAAKTSGGVGCHAYVEFDRMLPDIDFDAGDEPTVEEEREADAYNDALTDGEVRQHLYALSGLRARMSGGREVEVAVQHYPLR